MTMAKMTMRWRVLLLCASLALALAHASAADASPLEQQQHTSEHSDEVFDAVEHAHLSAAVSGCGLCQRTGQCDQAFRGTPGQFCQTLVSGAPCCCPADAQCVLTNMYNCRCRRTVAASGTASSPNVRTVTHTTTSSDSPKASSIVILLILLCCVCCCCCGASEKRKRQRERDYYAPVPTQYGTYPGQPPVAQPVYPSYAYPSAPPAFDDDNRYQHSGGHANSSFAAGALGGLAGLGAGVFLGSAFSGDNSRETTTTTTSYFGGDSGDSGFGGVSASTFEFSGDTGGGDDGGDFAGDS